MDFRMKADELLERNCWTSIKKTLTDVNLDTDGRPYES